MMNKKERQAALNAALHARIEEDRRPKSQKENYAIILVSLHRQGLLCTYCLLCEMNPTIAKPCQYHGVGLDD